MPAEDIKTELEKRAIRRLSNKESNQMTRECIQSALIELMHSTPFDKITITNLVQKSGVSRMAFYRNYASKQDVLTAIAGNVYDGVFELMRTTLLSQNVKGFYQKFFQMFKENQNLFDLMISAGLKTGDYLHIEQSISEHYKNVDATLRYRAAIWWGAFQSIVADWHAHGMEESIDEIAELCCNIMPPLPEVE